MAQRARLGSSVPILLKIAPDLEDRQLAGIAAVCSAAGIDGVIVSNTTISRPPVRSPHARQSGGLSGQPLFTLSTRKLARMYQLTGGKLPLIGVGGIDSAETAWQKIRAGASLIQLYTGLVYEGPSLIREICNGLARHVREAGLSSITEAVGTGAMDWLAD